ncbi:STAS domain-containing protein [Planctobacterium marinum]|nr:STAS domain-containing protein [Planctobacterium marinum]
MLKSVDKITLTYHEGCLKPEGSLTIESVPCADKQIVPLLSQFNEVVKLDLAAAENNDTAGLAWLINLKANLKKSGKSLQLLNVPNALKKLSKLSDADKLLEID